MPLNNETKKEVFEIPAIACQQGQILQTPDSPTLSELDRVHPVTRKDKRTAAYGALPFQPPLLL